MAVVVKTVNVTIMERRGDSSMILLVSLKIPAAFLLDRFLPPGEQRTETFVAVAVAVSFIVTLEQKYGM